jgi:NTP pyrophosphatase (non-canonical NTP hydrolase)
MSDFNDYQRAARETAIYPDHLRGIYPVLGICGGAGEVAEKVKKLHCDHGGTVDLDFCMALEKELGDILWYIANTASDYGLSLDGIASTNLKKLANRKARGTLQGSGDQR